MDIETHGTCRKCGTEDYSVMSKARASSFITLTLFLGFFLGLLVGHGAHP